jgi:hypothetical protein
MRLPPTESKPEEKVEVSGLETEKKRNARASIEAGKVPELELDLSTNFSPGGSCPRLSYWDTARQTWVDKGKVIHTANSEASEAVSVVSVPNDATRFRLSEEEPETSYIRDITLRLALQDGRTVEIAPDLGMSKVPDAPLHKIYPYSAVDFVFDVPKIYRDIGLKKAEVTIRGYYEHEWTNGPVVLSKN